MFFYFPPTSAPATCDNPISRLHTRYIVVTQGTTHYVASVFSSLLIAEGVGKCIASRDWYRPLLFNAYK